MAPGPMPDEAATDSTTVGVWALIWTIFVAKLASLALVVWAAHSFEVAALVSATTWPWLVIAAIFTVSPLLFRYRLRRVRARRRQLLQAEWTVDATPERAPDLGRRRRRA